MEKIWHDVALFTTFKVYPQIFGHLIKATFPVDWIWAVADGGGGFCGDTGPVEGLKILWAQRNCPFHWMNEQTKGQTNEQMNDSKKQGKKWTNE